MKAAAFALGAPGSLAEAVQLLQNPGARALAGGQSLGPMLNLRLVRPTMLVPLAGLRETAGAESDGAAVTIGATVTHAQIEDGAVPDIGDRILARIAQGIAYRAVRNRGTIGGSLCHADPASDWLSTLTALGASVLTFSAAGGRIVALAGFIAGAFTSVLGGGEVVRAVRVPRPSEAARFGYYKACRKPGEFAHAMAAVLIDPPRGVRRAAIGAVGGAPLLLEGEAVATAGAEAALAQSGLDAIGRHMQIVALLRALDEAAS